VIYIDTPHRGGKIFVVLILERIEVGLLKILPGNWVMVSLPVFGMIVGLETPLFVIDSRVYSRFLWSRMDWWEMCGGIGRGYVRVVGGGGVGFSFGRKLSSVS
jgi:hypothetical protein